MLKPCSHLQPSAPDRPKSKQSPQLLSNQLVATSLQAAELCQKQSGIFDLLVPWPYGLSGSQREALISELFQNTHLEWRGTLDGKPGEKDGRDAEVKKHLGLMWKDQVHCGLTCEKSAWKAGEEQANRKPLQ